MNIGVISIRYARAFLAYATEVKKADAVYQEMKQLTDNYVRFPDLRKAVENPVLAFDKKIELLLEASRCKVSSGDVSERFFRLVLDEKREKFLQFMVWSYIDLYRETHNILKGRLVTAVPSPELEKRMAALIAGKTKSNVEFDPYVDPEIIGGYVLDMAGYRIDASVSTQLKRVKNQFVSKNRRIV